MATTFDLVSLPILLLPVIGEPDPETRLFRQVGTKVECGVWFRAISEHVGPMVSPGGVSMFARVSRAGTYKRIREGRMTAFCFHESEKGVFGGNKIRSTPFIYVPISEARAWGAEMEMKKGRGESFTRGETSAGMVDFQKDFEWGSPSRRKEIKTYRGRPLR